MRASGSLEIVVDGTALTRAPGGARTRLAALYGAAARSTRLDPVVAVRGGFGLGSFLAAENLKTRPVHSFSLNAARLVPAFHPAARLAVVDKAFALAAETLPVIAVRGIPTVVTIHDLRFFKQGYSPLCHRLYARTFLRRNLKKAAAVVTVSATMADEIASFGLAPRQKIFVVPNAPPPSEAADREGRASSDLLDESRPYCLCVSRFEPRKNLLRLLEAFEIFARGEGGEYRLILAGSASGSDARSCLRRIAASQILSRRVEVLGVVDEGKKQALVRDAAFTLHPSLYEGFGMGILESMTWGSPMACSSIPAHWEVAFRAASFFDPYDPADMAAIMARLARSDSLRDDLRDAGKERAARFSWERSARLLEEVYTALP